MASYVIRLTADLDDSKVRQKIKKIQKEAKLEFGVRGNGYGGSGGKGGGTTMGGTTGGANGLRSKPRGSGKNTQPFKTYIAGAQQAEKANKRFGSTTLDITKKVIQFGATTAVIRGVTSGIGDAVQNVFELDKALTEFKKVSDLSGKGLENYTDQAFKVGRTVAKTGTEMVQAATEFKKSGFDEQDSMELARVASMYQNVADQELTAGEAANFITSQMKAYNMTAKDAEHIIGAVNEVSNKYAVSSADIATNIGKASAAMATGNITYEQGIGLMTAMTEITRNGAKSARGLVSIQSRYNQILDDSSTTGKKLTAWYKEHNIEIKDQNGQLKSFFKVGEEVAKKWNTMSENEKKYYLNIQAGANQSQNLAALMRNYGTAIKATADAENEQNSAAKENARYMESMEGKLQNLKSAWENFSRTMIDSDVVKDTIDGLTKALDFLASDAGQSMIKVARDVGVMYLAFRSFSKLFAGGKAVAGLLGFGKSTKLVTKALKGGGKHIDESAKAFGRLGKAAGSAAPALGAAGGEASSLLDIFALGGAGWGLLGAAGVVAGLIALNEHLDPENKYSQTVDALGQVKDKLSDVSTEIEKLEKKQEKSGLTKGEEARLDILNKQKESLEKQLKLYEELEKKQYIEKESKPDKKSGAQGRGVKSITKGAGGRGITDQDIVATTTLSSKLQKYNETANQAIQIKRDLTKAQKELNIAQKSGDLEGQVKAQQKITDLLKDYSKVTQKLPNEMDATKNKLNEWIDRFGSIQDITDDGMKKDAIAIQKVIKGYDDLTKKLDGISRKKSLAEQLSPQELQKITTDLTNIGTAIGVVKDESGNIQNIDFDKFAVSMESAGMSAEQTEEALIELSKTNPEATVTIDGVEVANENIETVLDFMDKLNGDDAEATVEVDGTEVAVNDIGDLQTLLDILDGKKSVTDIGVTGTEESKQKADEFDATVRKLPLQHNTNIKTTGSQQSEQQAEGVKKKLRTIPLKTTPKISVKPSGTGIIDTIRQKLASLNGTTATTYVHTVKDGKVGKNAKGTRNAPEGLSEVNEQGWELIRDAKTGKLRVAGGGKRTVTHLNEGDIVYTHAESMRMLSDEKDIEVPQHKKGKKSKYNKKVEKVKKEYESKLKDLEHKKEIKHWSDEEYQKQYNKLYKKYNEKIRSIKAPKKVKKVKSLGKEARYDIEESRASIAHDKATDIIESMIEDTRGTSEDLTKALTRINAERKAQRISLQEYEDYRKQAFKQHIDYDMKMFESNKKTYDSMKKELDEYYKSGKITAADYYDTLEQLVEKQFEKEKEVLEKKKEKTENTYSLARAYVNRQIEVLEKQNEKQEEQNDLMEKQNDLLKAKNKRVRVYREGIGFVYEQDTEAIREATKALKEYQTKEESAEMKAWKEVLNLFDEMDALAEISRLEQLVGATTSQLFGSFGTNLGQWTNWLKDNLATTMGLERLIDDMDEIVGYQNMMGFLGGANQTISTSQISSYIDRHRFASGTLSAPSGLARVGEQGYEIALLGKGDAVMPHNVSKNLMDWGNYSPLQFAKATSDVGNNIYNFDRLVLPNVSNANEFMKELEKLPNRAIQFGTSRI